MIQDIAEVSSHTDENRPIYNRIYDITDLWRSEAVAKEEQEVKNWIDSI